MNETEGRQLNFTTISEPLAASIVKPKQDYPESMRHVHWGNICLVLVVSVMTGMYGGYCQSYTNQMTPILEAKYGWKTAQEDSLYNSLIASSVILGLVVGCAVGGKVVQYGRRGVIIWALLVGIAGTGLTLIFNIWVFLFARMF